MVSVPPVGELIPTTNEPNEGSANCRSLRGVATGGMAFQRKEQGGNGAPLSVTGAGGPGV